MDAARFDRIEDKLDKLVEIQGEIRINVAEHIRRTEVAELNIEKLSLAIQPIQEHVAFIRSLGKMVAWVIGIAASLGGLIIKLRGGR